MNAGIREQLCSPNADCEYTGPGKYNCVCHEGYIGDGKQCERKWYIIILNEIKKLT